MIDNNKYDEDSKDLIANDILNNNRAMGLIMISGLMGDYSISINDFKFDDNDKE